MTYSTFGNKYYNRKWEISVSMKTGPSVILSSSDQTKNANLKCTFSVSGSMTFNFGDIVIYNLNKETALNVMKNGVGVTIKVGYYGSGEKGDYGTIWNNFGIVQCLTDKINGVDYTLTLHTANAKDIIDTWVVQPSANEDTVLNSMSSALKAEGLSIAKGASSSDKANARKKIFFCPAEDLLHEYENQYNSPVTINNTTGEIMFTREASDSAASVNVGKKYGLISQIVQLQSGIHFRCLMNPEITFRTKLKLDKSDLYIKEFYKVFDVGNAVAPVQSEYWVSKVTHFGDTRGNDWYSEVIGATDPHSVIMATQK